MEIRGIDVSAWQGKIDWKTVADYGMGFAILRITEAGNVIEFGQWISGIGSPQYLWRLNAQSFILY